MRAAIPRALVLAALLCSLAAGCARSVDADQARVCRSTIPALEPAGSRVEVVSASPSGAPHEIRVDYEAFRGGPRLRRFVLCRFAAEGLAGNKADLVGLSDADGPIAGATLYLLKHYYLDSSEGVAGDPGPGTRPADLVEIPRVAAYAVQQLLVSLPRTAVYGLLAAAYALVFGLVGRVNLAFGAVAAAGAAAIGLMVAGFAAGGLTAPPAGLAIGLVAALFAGALHNAVGGHFAFALIPAKRAQASLIATVGIAVGLSEYLRLAGGTITDWIPPLGGEAIPLLSGGGFVVSVTPITLVTGGIGITAATALVALMRLTDYGRRWRAASDDAVAAALFGVDGARLLTGTLALSGAMAGLAGALVAVQFGALGFAGGFQLGLKALAASILGGIGSVAGALIGGLAIGVFETLWSAWLPIEGRDLALYAILMMTIVLRPDGLLGSAPPLERRIR